MLLPRQICPIAQMVELSVDPVSLSGTEADATEFTITATAFGAVSGDQTIDLDLTGLDANDYTLSAPRNNHCRRRNYR